MKNKCPVCKKILDSSIQDEQDKPQFFPFCSERCKLIDLGDWLDARYVISSDVQSEELDESALPDTAYTSEEIK